MYRVLIAEDELLVRLGLKNSIRWHEFQMEVIADVSNGREAWTVYERDRPEVILTDLRMPVMDGMELIAKIRERDEKTKIVILTCLEEFDLIKRAISLGVSDYIVKVSMSTDDMESVLRKLQHSLRKEDAGLQAAPARIDADSIKDQLFKDFIFRHRYSEEEFAASAQQMRLRLHPKHLMMCVMEIDRFDLLRDRFKDRRGYLVRMSLLNVLNEVLGDYRRGEAAVDGERRYVLVFSFHDVAGEQKIYETLHMILSRIRNVMQTYFNISVSIGISSPRHGYRMLRTQFKECEEALERKFLHGLGRDYFWNQPAEGMRPDLRGKLCAVADEWGELGAQRREEFLAKAISLMQSDQLHSREKVQNRFKQWLQWPFLFIRLPQSEMTRLIDEFSDRISGAATLEETIDIFRSYVQAVLQLNRRTHKLSKEVQKVISFIETRYADDVSLQDAADHVSMSPNYISSLFKKELGVTFIDYLIQCRVERAKELLLETDRKVYEIAEQVGLENQSYFSRIFKKVTGVTPRSFRRRFYEDSMEDADDEELD